MRRQEMTDEIGERILGLRIPGDEIGRLDVTITGAVCIQTQIRKKLAHDLGLGTVGGV